MYINKLLKMMKSSLYKNMIFKKLLKMMKFFNQ